jgi:FAD/FMN-containing dehydrogenase
VEEWRSWSGALSFQPAERVRAGSEEEVTEAVRKAALGGRPVRPLGAGHSSMPLVETGGVLLSLDDGPGVETADAGALEAVTWAGATVHRVSHELLVHGLALENQGDIDVQCFAGAIGTGTHGTGATLRNLSSQVCALRLVTADGSVVEMDERDPERMRAVRVSLGALGIVTRLRLRVLPAYRLHERVWRVPIEECLDGLQAHITGNRHFEFFWFPSADRAEMKTLNPTQADPAEAADRKGERIGWSADIISSVRDIRFHEMEYSLPEAAGPDCFREVRKAMRERHPDVIWPVEYRTVAADDAFLSPHQGRPSVTISIHQDGRLPFREFFLDLEQILRARGGRPHWGKFHTATAEELRALYPDWERFRSVRAELDPEGRFLNAHLKALLG